VKDDDVDLKCESTVDIRTAAEQRMRINEQLAKFAGTWDQVKTSHGTPYEFCSQGVHEGPDLSRVDPTLIPGGLTPIAVKNRHQ
jgi:hypothetical protein